MSWKTTTFSKKHPTFIGLRNTICTTVLGNIIMSRPVADFARVSLHSFYIVRPVIH
jgi:hypothetical protein